MALIQCYECSKEISDKALACPQCGAPKSVPVRAYTEPMNTAGYELVIRVAYQWGKKHGPYEMFWDEGRLEDEDEGPFEIGTYKNGELDGLRITYHQNSEYRTYINEMRMYKDGAEHGPCVQLRSFKETIEVVRGIPFFREAIHESLPIMESKRCFKEGERDGEWEEYHFPTHKGDIVRHTLGFEFDYLKVCHFGLKRRSTWKDGISHGLYVEFDGNGEVVRKGEYHMGEKCGEWFEDGETVTYDSCPPDLEGGN